MKIETEIKDIDRDEVIEAMARQLIGEWVDETDYETGPYREHRFTRLGEAMKQYLDQKIKGLAETLVREKFDTVVSDRISVAVDEVLCVGWQKTDEYGSPSGQKVTLKDRISMFLNERDRYRSPNAPRIEELVKAAVEKTLGGEFKKEIDTAVKSLRMQLDAAVTSRFVDAIKSAMGVK